MQIELKNLRQRFKKYRNYLPWLIATLVFVGIAVSVISSVPPRSFIISTGTKNGIYYRFAQQYQRQLAREGIQVELRPGAGSVESLSRLTAGADEVEMYIRRLTFLHRNILIQGYIPFSYMHRVYILKAYINMVLEQLRERREELTGK